MNISKLQYYLLILATFSNISCREKKEPAEPQPINLEDVKNALETYKTKSIDLINSDTGWLNNGCDAMLWEGKYNSVVGLSNIRSSEFDNSNGRFGRTPEKRCYADGKDQGSKSTWSRDMSIGFIFWAWRTDNLSVLQDHARYGVENKWKMGEPFADGRVQYTPQLIGLLYNTIYALGGDSNHNRYWPTLWTSGLTDFQAHLQVLNIALQGEIAEKLNEADAIPAPRDTKKVQKKSLNILDVSSQMYDRLVEHSEREPNNVFFQTILAKYTGDFSVAINLCVKGSVGEYVRLTDDIHSTTAALSELIFSCDFILRQYED